MTQKAPYHKAQFGQYRLIRELGFGGMGMVYLAEDPRLERKIALKVLPAHFNANASLKLQFMREARAVARLNHPNIVTVFDVGEVEGQTYYTMQYVPGRTLREVIDISSLTLEKTAAAFAGICSAIAHAHREGIVHRDIKPANVILGEDSRPMVLDFGLAKVQSDEESAPSEAAMGTVNYMSPEQAQGKSVDHRTDIFSLGVLLYELLTGICPFVRGYIPATVQAIVHAEARPLRTYSASIPEGWQHLIDRALAKDAVHRYQSVEEVLHDLERLQQGRSVARRAIEQRPLVKLQRNAVAVLYLRNIGDKNDEYLSYGLTEDLIIDLTRYANLHVVPMRKILKYRDTTLEIDAIARELGVALVLDGSLMRSGDTFRLSAQLYDVVEGAVRWAQRWEEPVAGLHEVKKVFAEAVARAARGDETDQTVSVSGNDSGVSPVAYEYYLRANFLFEHKENRADVEAAMGLFQKAVEIDPGLLPARAGIASVHNFRANYEQARVVLEEALAEAKHRGRTSEAARMATMLGYVHALTSEFPTAHRYLDDAMKLSREAGNVMREVEACSQKLMICKLSGKVTGATELFERAMELADRLGDDYQSVQVLGHMAWIHLNEGEPERARKMLMTALPLARERGDRFKEAFLLNSIAASYMGTVSQNSAKKELEYYLKAREIWDQLKYERASGGQANNLGLVYLRQGRFREAHDSFEFGVGWMKQLGERSYHSMFLSNLSGAKTALGLYEEASETAREALAIAEEIDQQPFQAQALVALALAEHARGHTEDAEKLVHRAIDLSKDLAAQWQTVSARTLLGEIYFDTGRFEAARPVLQEAIEGAEKAGYEELAVRAACYLAAIAGISSDDQDADRQLSELADLTEGLYLWYVCQRLRGHMKLVGISSAEDKDAARTFLLLTREATEEAEYKFETDRIDAVLAAAG